ncbi:MAG: hypothetical protein HYZ28_28965 [Myxococcales bacterium]|nr:hypothetical protein [Myxococcales bacterium]
MRRRRGFVALALSGTFAAILCCDSPRGDPSLSFELFLSGAIADRVSSFQVALLSAGTALDCTAKQCLKDEVDPKRLVPLQDASGQQHTALLFPASLPDGGVQEVKAFGVPVGKDYTLVVEALSKSNPPALLGGSCTMKLEVKEGLNTSVLANPIDIRADGGVIDCDPRL